MCIVKLGLLNSFYNVSLSVFEERSDTLYLDFLKHSVVFNRSVWSFDTKIKFFILPGSYFESILFICFNADRGISGFICVLVKYNIQFFRLGNVNYIRISVFFQRYRLRLTVFTLNSLAADLQICFYPEIVCSGPFL